MLHLRALRDEIDQMLEKLAPMSLLRQPDGGSGATKPADPTAAIIGDIEP